MPNTIYTNTHFIKSGLLDYFTANPLSFLDIGARGGVHDIVEPISKITSVTGFEPNLAECQRLMQNPAVINPWHTFSLEPYALFSSEGESDFFEVVEPNNSSIYEPNPVLTNRYRMEKWKVKGRSKIAVTSLDKVHQSKYSESQYFGEFIKVDTQGSEYEILKGAENLLKKNTVGIMTEVSFCQLYSNQKLFSEVELLLRNYGFSFYGFSAQHYRSCKLLDKAKYLTRERLIYGDAIFLRDPFEETHPNITQRGARVLFLILLLFHLYDFAIELIRKQEIYGYQIMQEKHALDLIKCLAYEDPKNTFEKISLLYKQSLMDEDSSNALAAKFLAELKGLSNYDDFFGLSPLPKTL